MKQLLPSAAAAAVLACTPLVSQAGDHILQGRLTPIGYGDYDFDVKFNLNDGSTFGTDTGGDYLSSDLGFTYIYSLESAGAIISDLELEYFQVDADSGGEFERTDLKLTLGYKTPVNVVPFVGYRRAVQGDGFFDDEFAIEKGFFLGGSYTGIPLGDFASMSVSAAYNFNNYEVTDSFDFDTGGISAKVSVLLSAIPIAINLKYQSFSETDSKELKGLGVDNFSYKETYTTYLNFTWYYATKVM